MLETLVLSWLLLTGACLALLALVIGAQWSLAMGRRALTALRGTVVGHVSPAAPRVINVADHGPAATPRLYSVAGK